MQLYYDSKSIFNADLGKEIENSFTQLSLDATLEINIDRNEILVPLLVSYLHLTYSSRLYRVNLTNISHITAAHYEEFYPKVNSYRKHINDSTIEEIHFVYRNYPIQNIGYRLEISQQFVHDIAASIIPGGTYKKLRAMAPEELRVKLGSKYTQNYSELFPLQPTATHLVSPSLNNNPNVDANLPQKPSKNIDLTIAQLHALLREVNLPVALTRLDMEDQELRTTLGKIEFNLTFEKLRSLTPLEAAARWPDRYHKKITDNRINIHDYNLGLIHAVMLLKKSMTAPKVAGRLGVTLEELKHKLYQYGFNLSHLRNMTPEQVRALVPSYRRYILTEKDRTIPLPEDDLDLGTISQAAPVSSSSSSSTSYFPSPQKEVYSIYPSSIPIQQNLNYQFLPPVNLGNNQQEIELLENHAGFTRSFFNIVIPFKLHIDPATGALIITPLDNQQLNKLQEIIEENQVKCSALYDYLYISETDQINNFFEKCFIFQQNLFDKTLLASGKFTKTSLTTFQILTFIAVGLCIYELNKHKLNFNYKEEKIHCPWIDANGNFCIEMIDRDNKKYTIVGLDKCLEMLTQMNIVLPPNLLTLLQRQHQYTENVFELIDEAAKPVPEINTLALNPLERCAYSFWKTSLIEDLKRTIKIIYDSNTPLSTLKQVVEQYNIQETQNNSDHVSSFIKNFLSERNYRLIGEYRAAKIISPTNNKRTSHEISQSTSTRTDPFSFWQNPNSPAKRVCSNSPSSSYYQPIGIMNSDKEARITLPPISSFLKTS